MYVGDMVDPYLYPDTEVLINKLGLKNQVKLDRMERRLTHARAMEPLPKGRFSINHFFGHHHHIFQDIYDWAGKPRVMDLAKGGSVFCRAAFIQQEIKKLFKQLAAENNLRALDRSKFAKRFAYYHAELNAIHPFREGNGRTINLFMLHMSEFAGHPLDENKIDPTVLLNASIDSFKSSEVALAALVYEALDAR